MTEKVKSKGGDTSVEQRPSDGFVGCAVLGREKAMTQNRNAVRVNRGIRQNARDGMTVWIFEGDGLLHAPYCSRYSCPVAGGLDEQV